MMNLESILSKTSKGVNWYLDSVKNNWKSFLPATMISVAFVAAGQYVTSELIDNPSELVTQLSGYWSAVLGGYSTFLGLEYYTKKENYPNGFLSKEMGKTFVDVWTADYLSDIMSYTPVFVATNHYMLNHGFSEGVSGAVTGLSASTAYFFVMCGMYDATKIVNSYIVKGAKQISKTIKNIFSNKNSQVI